MNSQDYQQTIFNIPFIAQRADPYIYQHDGFYLFTASVPEYDRIIIRKAKSIDKLKLAEEVVIWKKHAEGSMSFHIWAPEIHYISGKWYVFFAAGEIDDIWAIRPYVLECKDDDPISGKWGELGILQGCDDYSFKDFSLDATVFEHRDRLYCVWAEKVSVGKKISNLYIAEMIAPNKLGSKQVLLSSPDYDWERVDFWVNEGPSILKHADKIYLLYSASATGECYCMGMLGISVDDDILNPRAWIKERHPVLKSDNVKGLYGPGHNSFTKSEDGTEDIMLYHARQYDEITCDPLYDINRHTYRMKIQWDITDKPIFRFENNF